MPYGRKTFKKKSTAKKARRKGERIVKYGTGFQLRKVKR